MTPYKMAGKRGGGGQNFSTSQKGGGWGGQIFFVHLEGGCNFFLPPNIRNWEPPPLPIINDKSPSGNFFFSKVTTILEFKLRSIVQKEF